MIHMMNEKDLRLFRKVCEYLASDNAGERDNAAVKASRMLSDRGLRWSDLMFRTPAFSASPFDEPQPERRGYEPAEQWPQPEQWPPRRYREASERAAKVRQRSTTRNGYKAADLIKFCAHKSDRLSGWDLEFISSLYQQKRFGLTDSQWTQLFRIGKNLGAVHETVPSKTAC
jgi:hypothetical protein